MGHPRWFVHEHGAVFQASLFLPFEWIYSGSKSGGSLDWAGTRDFSALYKSFRSDFSLFRTFGCVLPSIHFWLLARHVFCVWDTSASFFSPLVSVRIDVRPFDPSRSSLFAPETLRVRRCRSAARRVSSPANRSTSAMPRVWRASHSHLETVNSELNSREGDRWRTRPRKDASSRSCGRQIAISGRSRSVDRDLPRGRGTWSGCAAKHENVSFVFRSSHFERRSERSSHAACALARCVAKPAWKEGVAKGARSVGGKTWSDRWCRRHGRKTDGPRAPRRGANGPRMRSIRWRRSRHAFEGEHNARLLGGRVCRWPFVELSHHTPEDGWKPRSCAGIALRRTAKADDTRCDRRRPSRWPSLRTTLHTIKPTRLTRTGSRNPRTTS